MNTFYLKYSGRTLKILNVDDNDTVKHLSTVLISDQHPDLFKNKAIYLKPTLTGNKISKEKTYFSIRTLGDELQWHEGNPLLVAEVGPPVRDKWKCTVQ